MTTKLELLEALVHASEVAKARLPKPGTHLLAEFKRGSVGCCSGEFDTRYYADVEPAIGNAVYVTFRPHDRKPVRRAISVAIDGSWRCADTLMPVNIFGEIAVLG
jgi:hypothetical protein